MPPNSTKAPHSTKALPTKALPTKALRERTHARIKGQLSELPMLPTVVARLADLDIEDDDFVADVESLANCDPNFTVRLIHLANTGAQRKENAALTIKQAITRVGARALAEIVRVNNVMRTFVPVTHGQKFLWGHSLEVANASRVIAAAHPERGVNPDFAYLCGLLHDIGRFIMFEESPDELGAISETGWVTPADLIAAEEAICGYDHAALGGLAMAAWRLPDELIVPVRDHHKMGSAAQYGWNKEQAHLITVIQMADATSLLLQEETFLTADTNRRIKMLDQQCVYPGWDHSPMKAERLVTLLPEIISNSESMAESIGIHSKHRNQV